MSQQSTSDSLEDIDTSSYIKIISPIGPSSLFDALSYSLFKSFKYSTEIRQQIALSYEQSLSDLSQIKGTKDAKYTEDLNNYGEVADIIAFTLIYNREVKVLMNKAIVFNSQRVKRNAEIKEHNSRKENVEWIYLEENQYQNHIHFDYLQLSTPQDTQKIEVEPEQLNILLYPQTKNNKRNYEEAYLYLTEGKYQPYINLPVTNGTYIRQKYQVSTYPLNPFSGSLLNKKGNPILTIPFAIEIQRIIKHFHGYNHLCLQETVLKIQQIKLHWETMNIDVKRFLDNCQTCSFNQASVQIQTSIRKLPKLQELKQQEIQIERERERDRSQLKQKIRIKLKKS